MEHGQMDRLKEDVKEKFEKAKETFPSGAEGSAEPENAESLQLFGFICELAFDVFLKKQMIERLADDSGLRIRRKRKNNVAVQYLHTYWNLPPELPFGCMADYGQTNIPKDLRPEADPHFAPVRRSFSSYLIFPHRPHHRVFRIRDA